MKDSKEIDTSHDDKVLQIILKFKARADHNNTPLPEVKSALRMASRLQIKHNITDVDLQSLAPKIKMEVYGRSIVHILPLKPGSVVVEESWVSVMANAMITCFDCDGCSESFWDHELVAWTFFGYASNTRSAAEAFEVVHNQMLEWARDKKKGRNSYCLGIANGLVDVAEEEMKQQKEFIERQQEALRARRREEKLARDRELNRLHGLQIDYNAQNTQETGSEARPPLLSINPPHTTSRVDDIVDDDDANDPTIKTEEGIENSDSEKLDIRAQTESGWYALIFERRRSAMLSNRRRSRFSCRHQPGLDGVPRLEERSSLSSSSAICLPACSFKYRSTGLLVMGPTTVSLELPRHAYT